MPDPKGFFEWMKSRGVKVTVNEHYGPFTRDNDVQLRRRFARRWGCPKTPRRYRTIIADKKYADLFMDLLHKPALDMGMAFWWQDGAAATSMNGLDPYLWTRHVEYTGSERITGKRTTAFCRLGTAVGSHRYGVFFTGDLHGHVGVAAGARSRHDPRRQSTHALYEQPLRRRVRRRPAAWNSISVGSSSARSAP